MNRLSFPSLLFFLVTLPLWAQEPPPAVKVDDPTAAITQLREGLVTSFNKGDIDGLLTYLDPNVVVTWQNGEMCHGPEAVKAFYTRMMTGEKRVVRKIESKPEILGRHINGDWAISWGNLHDHFILTDGADLPFNSVFTGTIAKRGDRWLLTAFHTSVSVFQNPVLALTQRRTARWVGVGGVIMGLLVGFGLARMKKGDAGSR